VDPEGIVSDEPRRSLDAFLNKQIYSALDPAIIAAIEDDGLELAIVDFVAGRANARSLDVNAVLAGLNPAFSHVYATWITEAEVFNGGFNQFFFNDSGRLAPEAAAGYSALGAPRREQVVRTAMQRLLDRSVSGVPPWSERTFEAFSASYAEGIFTDLDQAFYALDEVEDGPQLRVAYVRAHLDELTA
jgi:hypothetical protein